MRTPRVDRRSDSPGPVRRYAIAADLVPTWLPGGERDRVVQSKVSRGGAQARLRLVAKRLAWRADATEAPRIPAFRARFAAETPGDVRGRPSATAEGDEPVGRLSSNSTRCRTCDESTITEPAITSIPDQMITAALVKLMIIRCRHPFGGCYGPSWAERPVQSPREPEATSARKGIVTRGREPGAFVLRESRADRFVTIPRADPIGRASGEAGTCLLIAEWILTTRTRRRNRL